MEFLTIYILCHDRPDFARQAILSVVRQNCQSFTLTVSDNSSNDDVENMIKGEFPGIHYIRRTPMLKPLEHFNRCIDETQTDYFCLFHDDDVMSPDFVEIMRKCLSVYPTAIACGCNAKIESFGKLETRTSFRAIRDYELITTPRNLARRYFSRAQSGIAPFPGYVYKLHLVGDQRLPVDGGKYADVTWLLNLAGKGPIIWVTMPLMAYRIHESSDGGFESLRDRLRFFGYLKQNRAMFGEGLLNDYRSFVYKKILKTHVGPYSKRHRLAISFLNRHRWSRYARADYWKSLAVRTLVKWVSE
jgi:glycosyltransferase involved in cell wall biosynthesis